MILISHPGIENTLVSIPQAPSSCLLKTEILFVLFQTSNTPSTIHEVSKEFLLPLVELHKLLLAHFSSLLKVRLDVIMILRPISQFGVISKCAEGALCPTIQTIKENVEGDWTQY
ncbi:hypothetical protein HGM15179_007716 [Zosterops borbonicus]|uniref:Uncharacterized protein n=1 Tax=Zosterops borbonicus TaxID=364589 RepID=A0A8K1GJW0_9PASS|nr:hypothetical protein HGM15179_007716 [Zosterops borbonicus]